MELIVALSFAALCLTNGALLSHAFAVPLSPTTSSSSSTMTMMASSPRHQSPPKLTTPIPPPPPVSMPVWSLSCPNPFPATRSSPSSSMSILTFVTPVSVSSPKLWAISLYKTTLTRCAFLGVPSSGEEYNDAPSISSSVTTTPMTATNVRRREDMGEPGTLGSGSSRGEAAGRKTERRRALSGETTSAGTAVATSGGGVGILQLLSPDQAKLVPILGKQTGWDGTLNKREKCADLENGWVTVAGSDEEMQFEVLPDCASYLQVKLRRVTDGGDHDVVICNVTGTGVWDAPHQTVRWRSEEDGEKQPALDPSTALYTGQLREEGII